MRTFTRGRTFSVSTPFLRDESDRFRDISLQDPPFLTKRNRLIRRRHARTDGRADAFSGKLFLKTPFEKGGMVEQGGMGETLTPLALVAQSPPALYFYKRPVCLRITLLARDVFDEATLTDLRVANGIYIRGGH